MNQLFIILVGRLTSHAATSTGTQQYTERQRHLNLPLFMDVFHTMVNFSKTAKMWHKYIRASLHSQIRHHYTTTLVAPDAKADHSLSDELCLLHIEMQTNWRQKISFVCKLPHNEEVSPANKEINVTYNFKLPIATLFAESRNINYNVSWHVCLDTKLRMVLSILSLHFLGSKIQSCGFGSVSIFSTNKSFKIDLKTYAPQDQFIFCGILSGFLVFVENWHIKILLEVEEWYKFSMHMNCSLIDKRTAVTSTSSAYNNAYDYSIRPMMNKIEFYFWPKKVVSFHHHSVSRYMMIYLGMPKSFQHTLYDGPETLCDILSSSGQDGSHLHYTTSTFQCLLQMYHSSQQDTKVSEPNNIHVYFRRIPSARLSQHHLISANISVTYPNFFCPLFVFCPLLVESPRQTFLMVSVKKLQYSGLLSTDCSFGGVNFYSRRGMYFRHPHTSRIPDFVECSNRNSQAHFRPIYSEAGTMILSFHAYNALVTNFTVHLVVAMSKCKGILINACAFYQNEFYRGTRTDITSMARFIVTKDQCLVLQIEYFTQGLTRIRDNLLSCSMQSQVHRKSPDISQQELSYNVTTFFMTYLPALTRCSEAILDSSKCVCVCVCVCGC